jgi:hypothetical protein
MMKTIKQFPTWFAKQKRGGKMVIGWEGYLYSSAYVAFRSQF